MSTKHARVEAIRKLKEQLAVATDPETVLKITGQIAKMTPRPRQARRPPRAAQIPIKAKKGTSPIVAKWADRLSHMEPEGKRIEWAIILEYEERAKEKRRTTGQTFTEDEKRTLIGELFNSLSAEEYAALNGGSQEVA